MTRPFHETGADAYDYEDSIMDMKFIDWHSADIIAALRKKGTSLAA